jgi:hypothetical protein
MYLSSLSKHNQSLNNSNLQTREDDPEKIKFCELYSFIYFIYNTIN